MPAHLTFIPDQSGVRVMMDRIAQTLAVAVQGPYRLVHHAMLPYVRIAPATPTEPVIIQAHPDLRLDLAHGESRRLCGLDDVLDCGVSFSGVLQELGRRAVALDSVDPLHPMSRRRPPAVGVPRHRLPPDPTPPAREVPEGGVVKARRAVQTNPLAAPRLVVVPEAPPSVPPVTDVPVPELLAQVCQAEDVHPDLGDYLVIPMTCVPASEPLPSWVVRYDVPQIRVVKPRLKVDRPAGDVDA
jgi:hypothetical protein